MQKREIASHGVVCGGMAGAVLLFQEFPILRNLGIAAHAQSVSAQDLAGIVNSTSQSRYCVARIAGAQAGFDLQVIGVGGAAYFAWSDRTGAEIGRRFGALEPGVTQRFSEAFAALG